MKSFLTFTETTKFVHLNSQTTDCGNVLEFDGLIPCENRINGFLVLNLEGAVGTVANSDELRFPNPTAMTSIPFSVNYCAVNIYT